MCVVNVGMELVLVTVICTDSELGALLKQPG